MSEEKETRLTRLKDEAAAAHVADPTDASWRKFIKAEEALVAYWDETRTNTGVTVGGDAFVSEPEE